MGLRKEVKIVADGLRRKASSDPSTFLRAGSAFAYGVIEHADRAGRFLDPKDEFLSGFQNVKKLLGFYGGMHDVKTLGAEYIAELRESPESPKPYTIRGYVDYILKNQKPFFYGENGRALGYAALGRMLADGAFLTKLGQTPVADAFLEVLMKTANK